jgi:dimethylamine/trimethylamine dehydrogenase
LAELLARAGSRVTYVTPAGHASAWTIMTNEQPQVHRALATAGVGLKTLSLVAEFRDDALRVTNLFTGEAQSLPCKSLIIVGARAVEDALYRSLLQRRADWEPAGIVSVDCIGDALAPGAIAHAVHSAHRYARELDQPAGSGIYRRDSAILESAPVLYDEGQGVNAP